MKIQEKLFNLAVQARENSYSPYSGFKVGAAIYADDGNFYAAANVENISFPCGACAETGAISAMIAGGGKKIKEILILAESPTLIAPCGACRQRIAEFAEADTVVHLADLDGIKKSLTIAELLPLAFKEFKK